MTPLRIRYLVTVTLILTATTSCQNTLAPVDAVLKGTYALTTVNGMALPADLSNGDPGRLILLSETIRFDGAGRAIDDMTERDSLSSAPAQVVFATIELSYHVDGSVVHFKALCGPGASCTQVPDATIVDAKDFVIQNGVFTYDFHNPR
jgi:hypothetical protein